MRRNTLIALAIPILASAQFGSYWSPASPNLKYDDRWVFTRLRYHPSSSWSHDYPRADRHLAYIVADLSKARVRTDGSMAAQMRRVLPERQWIEIDVTHPVFHMFFDLKKIDYHHPMLPGMVPEYKALFAHDDPNGRMIALANHNNDLAEYWEWSDRDISESIPPTKPTGSA